MLALCPARGARMEGALDDRKLTGPAAATVAFTVVVAGVGMGACGDEVTVYDGQGGASTGTTNTGGTAGSTTVSTSSTTTTGHEHCDPACAGVTCPQPQQLQPSGTLVGTTLTMAVDLPQYIGSMCLEEWAGAPTVTVDAELGTLVSTTANDDGTIEIVIEMAPGSTGGEVTVEMEPVVVSAWDCDSSTLEHCQITRTFTVAIGPDGDPVISRLEGVDDPALQRRPPMRLTFVEGHGTEATIEVQGAPADLALRFDVTDGEVQAEGSTARWRLPERAGWYQIEVVAERDGVLATDALMVEVRPTANRA